MTAADADLTTRAWLKLGVRSRDRPAMVALEEPLSEARLGLVSTGGAYLASQDPFETGKRGDPSFRPIPADVEPGELRWVHPHYDTSVAREDPDVVFPLRLTAELAREGVVGGVAPTAVSMMGYVPLTRTLEGETAPAIGELMQGEEVDAALLCPA
jgi:D-proline reductase (dithiol) PrdB